MVALFALMMIFGWLAYRRLDAKIDAKIQKLESKLEAVQNQP